MTLYHFKLDLLICALFDAYLFVDLVALSNGLHGSVQMDSVASPPWNTHMSIPPSEVHTIRYISPLTFKYEYIIQVH